MAMLPTLPTQKTIMVNQMCRHILPGNVAETCFPVQERNEGNFSTIVHAAVLHNHVPSPAFCAVFQLLGGSHIPPRSWPALPKLYQIGRSFSFQIDILEKQ